ncbi:hypothetical protein OZX73_00505 [Bifidobacterium sp. ESL0775]|uniref:hypothetical protein n=1 Tax=Bifidobacterium sp. ESL0775 TaxID=2983230 RepID=UPI0023F641E3|nr:hypothetical protein [Bifidobacterium sp. ESL0775]WEV69415.1 hypothetical protein OZX73_00505 [Bifidobacterium sp. ESL0775]
MHNNDDFDPPPQAGHHNSLSQPGSTSTSSQAAPSRRDTDASTAAHPTKSAVAHSNTPSKSDASSKPGAVHPNAPSAPDAAHSQTTPSPSAKAQPSKTGKTNGHPSASPTTQSVAPSPAAQSDDTSNDEAIPSLRIQAATLPTTQSPVLAKTNDTALTTTEPTPDPQADPDAGETAGRPQTRDTAAQEPTGTSGVGQWPTATSAAPSKRARHRNTATGTNTTGATGMTRAAADHDGAQAGTPQAQDEPEAGPQDTCPATTPAALGTSNVTWNIDATCTLHLSGGTHTGDGSAMPWNSLKTTVTTIHIDGDLTLNGHYDNGYNHSGMFSGMTSLRSVTPGAPVHLKDNATFGMFSSDTSLATADLSNWDAGGATSLGYMFDNCSSLTTLDLHNFTGWGQAYSMFYYCSSLTTLNLHNFKGIGLGLLDGCNSLVSLDMYSSNLATTFARYNVTFPASLRKLAIGGSERGGPGELESDPLSTLEGKDTTWDRTSGLGDHIDYLGQIGTTGNLRHLLWNTNSAGYYVDDSLVHVESTVDIDPAGGSASPASYTRDNKLTEQTVGVPASILTNKPGCLFTGWKDQNGTTYTDTNNTFTMPQGKYTYYKLTAQWKPFAPSVGAAYRNGSAVSLNVGINAAAPAGSQTSARTGRGGTGNCNAINTNGSTCMISWDDVASLEPTPGATYSVTATTTGTDPKTGKQVSASSDPRTGTLPWMTVKFAAGTLADGTHPSGTTPNDLTGLVDGYGKTTVTLPRRGSLSVPDDTWFGEWAYSDNTQITGNGSGVFYVEASHGYTDAGGHTTVTITAHWRTMEAPKITDLSVDGSTQTVGFKFGDNLTPAGWTNTASTSMGWSSATCTDSTCTASAVPASDFQTEYGDTYTITATSRATNPDTGRPITKTTTKSGVLDYVTVNFDKGTGTGVAPGKMQRLLDTSTTNGSATLTMPGQSGMIPPAGRSFHGWKNIKTGLVHQGGARSLLLKSDGTTTGAETVISLTADWDALAPPSLDSINVSVTPGQTPVVNIRISASHLPAGSSTVKFDTSRSGGSVECTVTNTSTMDYNTCQARWDLDKLIDLSQDSTYAYSINASVTANDPDTGERATKTAILTGTVPYMAVSFAPNGGTGSADTVTAPVDTNSQKAQLRAGLPGLGGMTAPGNSYLAGWKEGTDTWNPGDTPTIDVSRGTTDSDGRTSLTLTAQWAALSVPTIDLVLSSVSAGSDTTLNVSASNPGAPHTNPRSSATSLASDTGLSYDYGCGSTCSYRGPVSGLINATPGVPYSLTATTTVRQNNLVIGIVHSAPATGTLPYMAISFTTGTGGSGTAPATINVLADSSTHAAAPDLPNGTGMSGPAGASFGGWHSTAANATWPSGHAYIPASAGTTNDGVTAVTLDATWRTIAVPSGMTASYHAGQVTLKGTAMGTGDDTVKACMTGGSGGDDICKTATNPRPAIAPATLPAGTNPRVERFDIDPTDPGKITIGGTVDIAGGTFIQERTLVCPHDTPAPTSAAPSPAGCTLITNYVRNTTIGMGPATNAPWNGRVSPTPQDKNVTTLDTDFTAGPGLYDIWAFSYNIMSRSITTPLKVYGNYPYRVQQPAASWDWSVTFNASDYTGRYGIGGQHHFTAIQISDGANSDGATLEGTLPWLKATFAPDMPGGATATAPDAAKGLVDSQSPHHAVITLARPTESMEPTDGVFLGWSLTGGATTPDTGMGSPTARDVELTGDTGSTETDATLHAVWRTLNQPSIDTATSRDLASKDVTLTGGATPWANDETVEATVTGLNGQTGTSVGTAQTPTLDTAGAYDGATRHGWTLTLPGAGIPLGGRYRVSASAVGDDGAWRGVAHRYAKATATQDVTIPGGIPLHALPLTGGTARRTATLLALTLGATLLLLAAATRLRDRRREQGQGHTR